MKRVAREDRKRQHHERYDANPMGRQKVVDRKEEPGRARRHRARQKKRSPAVEPFPGEQADRTTNPEKIPTRLNTTCTEVNVDIVMPKIMMRVLSD